MGVSYQSILGVSLSHTGHMDGEVLAAGASRPWKSFVCSDTHICPLSMISIRGGGWKIVYLFTLGPLPLSAAAAFTFNFTLRSGHSLCRCTWTPFYLPEMKMAKISCIFHFLTFESLRLVQVFTAARIASTLSLLLLLLDLSFNSETQGSVFLTITCVVDSEMNKFVWEWDTISGYAALFNFFHQAKSLLIHHCWRKGLYYNVIICSTNIDNQLSTKMIMCPILSFWNSTTTIQKVAWKTSWHQFELLGRCDARLTIYDATSEF